MGSVYRMNSRPTELVDCLVELVHRNLRMERRDFVEGTLWFRRTDGGVRGVHSRPLGRPRPVEDPEG